MDAAAKVDRALRSGADAVGARCEITELPGYLFGNYTVGRRLRVDRPLNPSSLSRILKKYCDAAGVDLDAGAEKGGK